MKIPEIPEFIRWQYIIYIAHKLAVIRFKSESVCKKKSENLNVLSILKARIILLLKITMYYSL